MMAPPRHRMELMRFTREGRKILVAFPFPDSCLQSISDNRKGSIQRGCLQLERNKGLKSFLEGLRDEATSTRP
ncbi:hypothetical protein Lal_00042212 [Lupinus albus]|nr:hypothetical protein Lal_00042212 [Lupinus albus]